MAPATVSALGHRLQATFDQVIASGAPVALLDYPNHENVGDAAIWLGEMRYLHDRGCEVRYHADETSYRSSHLRALLPEGIVLLHGGGNLGDIWPSHQLFREAVIVAHPTVEVVQLPQTVHFRDKSGLERAKRVFGSHERFTLMVRDEESLAFAQDHFACRTLLCPDAAFALGPFERRSDPTTEIVWLRRTDTEARDRRAAQEVAAEVEEVDWIGVDTGGVFDVNLRRVLRPLAGHLPRRVGPAVWHAWRYLAERRLEVGLAVLTSGRVVVTDRLHGHILSLLCDLPHVVLDNNYGKLSAFTRTWGTLGGRARFALTDDEAIAQAAALLRSSGP